MTTYLAQANVMELPIRAGAVDCIVTSPPYWALRSYNTGDLKAAELGSEALHDCNGAACGECFVCHVVAYCREFRRVLSDTGTFFLNLGDSYSANRGYQVPDSKHKDVGNNSGSKVPPGLKPLDLVGIPWRAALALQADGWYLRSDLIWHKKSPMPESVNGWRWERHRVKVKEYADGNLIDFVDWVECPGCPKCADNDGLVLRRGSWRPTKAHEYIFLLAKSKDYYCDAEAVREATQRTAAVGWKDSDLAKYSCDPRFEKQGTYKDWRKYCPTGEVSARNARTVQQFKQTNYSGAHFATFPPSLPHWCIRAGSPEKVCSECGAPWAKVVERQGSNWQERKDAGAPTRYGISNNKGEAITNYGGSQTTTHGTRPTCQCNADPRPALVLDPFNGSGSTGIAARELGRDYIGLDLSAEYLQQARERLGLAALGEWTQGSKTVDAPNLDGLPMFDICR